MRAQDSLPKRERREQSEEREFLLNILEEAIVPTRTFALHYYVGTATHDDDFDDAVSQLFFANATNLTVKRGGTSRDQLNYTWWTIESLDGAFSVQNVTGQINIAKEDVNVTIDSVQKNKTWLVSSYDTTEASDNADAGTQSIRLTNDTNIRLGRSAGTNVTDTEQNDVLIFVITFSGNETVQSEEVHFNAGTKVNQSIISPVNSSNSMIYGANLFSMGEGENTGDHKDIHNVYTRMVFINDSLIQTERISNTGEARNTWQVVEWIIQVAGAEPPADSCDYTSGNWDVDCSDSCVIASDIDIDAGGNITMTGTGTFIINDGVRVSGWTRRHADATCFYQSFGNGGFFQ